MNFQIFKRVLLGIAGGGGVFNMRSIISYVPMRSIAIVGEYFTKAVLASPQALQAVVFAF